MICQRDCHAGRTDGIVGKFEMVRRKYADLKRHTHCLLDTNCDPNECDSWENCAKIRAHHRRGEILWRGEWREATEQDIKRYRDMFGDEWLKDCLGVDV